MVKLGVQMLVKIENGFYLNSQHIIAIHVSKCESSGDFFVNLEYTPNSFQKIGQYKITFHSKSDAENYLHTLNNALK